MSLVPFPRPPSRCRLRRVTRRQDRLPGCLRVLLERCAGELSRTLPDADALETLAAATRRLRFALPATSGLAYGLERLEGLLRACAYRPRCEAARERAKRFVVVLVLAVPEEKRC